jgi:hypothetical protein
VNGFTQKARSFSASPELLASSFDQRPCDDRTRFLLHSTEISQVPALSFCLSAIFSKLFHFSALAAPILPFITRIRPGRFATRPLLA